MKKDYQLIKKIGENPLLKKKMEEKIKEFIKFFYEKYSRLLRKEEIVTITTDEYTLAVLSYTEEESKKFLEYLFEKIKVKIEEKIRLNDENNHKKEVSIPSEKSLLEKDEKPDTENMYLEFGNETTESVSSTLDSLGIFLSQLGKSIKDEEENIYYLKKIANGDNQAKQEFFSRSLWLVVFFAKKITTNRDRILDLIQEGSIGLLKAIDNFDLSRTNTFGTYASFWIKSYINNYQKAKTKEISIPVDVQNMYSKVERAKEILKKKLGREPIDSEMAAFLDMSISNYQNIVTAMATRVISADYPNDDGLSLISNIPSNGQMPDDIALDSEIYGSIIKNLSKAGLTNREIAVVIMVNGLDGNGPRTLKRIADPLSLSFTRIRQIRVKAYRKIRKSPLKNSIIGYLVDDSFEDYNVGVDQSPVETVEASFDPEKEVNTIINIVNEYDRQKANKRGKSI